MKARREGGVWKSVKAARPVLLAMARVGAQFGLGDGGGSGAGGRSEPRHGAACACSVAAASAHRLRCRRGSAGCRDGGNSGVNGTAALTDEVSSGVEEVPSGMMSVAWRAAAGVDSIGNKRAHRGEDPGAVVALVSR